MTDSWVTTHDARPFNDRVVHKVFVTAYIDFLEVYHERICRKQRKNSN